MTTQQQPVLSAAERQALNAFKWRYSLEAVGFTREQAARLLFWRWQHRRRRVTG